MMRLESRILKRNTIALDWGKLSRCSYTYATEFFVPKIGYFLHRALSEVLKLNLRSVNCVGHSLGAHICGYAGAASGGQFDRCFGKRIIESLISLPSNLFDKHNLFGFDA